MTSPASPSACAVFEPDGKAVAAARGFVRNLLVEWDADEVVDDAVLLVSELVTNAVVHAGTSVQVNCSLEGGAVRVDVQDQHPARGMPDWSVECDLDDESGRGLLVSATLASAWGVTYTRTRKNVWFRLDRGSAGSSFTTLATAIERASELPAIAGQPRVAVIRTDLSGRITAWGDEAVKLFGWTVRQACRLTLTDLLSWPDERGLSPGDVAGLARWQGECAARHRQGRIVPAFASTSRVVGEDGEPGVVWLVVERAHRPLLEAPDTHGVPHATAPGGVADPVILPDALVARLTLDEMLQRTVERARDVLDGDAAYLLLAREDETELEVRASSGSAPALPRRTRLAAEEVLGGLHASRLPVVHDDVGERSEAMALMRGTGMRSLLTVPLLVEARIIGVLCVAAERAGWFDNDGAMRLQGAADRIALILERARLAELERASRGWLSFLAEASDLLAGTLDQQMTLALVAQLVVPRLATWCAVHTVEEGGGSRLAYVWHADEAQADVLRSMLEKVPAPEPRAFGGGRPWSGPTGNPADNPAGNQVVPAAEGVPSDIAVTFPLLARGRSLGSLTLGRPGGARFPREVLALADDLSRRAAVALDNARLYSERATTSRALQRSLLPSDVPQVRGVDLAVHYSAAGEGNEVGGDFYDVFGAAGDASRFVVGDVCGTGPEAAAVTGLARHTLRILGREGYSVPAVLERLNVAILEEGPRARFLTLVCGELTPRDNGGVRLALVSAGHPPPLRLRPDGSVDAVAEPQPLLGVLDEVVFEADVVDLDPGDVLLCVTDGVTERRSGDRLLGDDDGLDALLAECTGLSAGAVAARIQRAVTDFAPDPASDDIAILVLRAL